MQDIHDKYHGAPSTWLKNKRTSVRVNDEVVAILQTVGLSPQKLLNQAIDALLWIRDENGDKYPTGRHPMLSEHAESLHMIRPPVVPIPRFDELVPKYLAVAQRSRQQLAHIARAQSLPNVPRVDAPPREIPTEAELEAMRAQDEIDRAQEFAMADREREGHGNPFEI